MDKSITLIVAASVIGMLALVLLVTTTGALGDVSKTTNQTEVNTKCQVQIREAKSSNQPSLMSEKCADYASNHGHSTLASNWEKNDIVDLIT